LVRAQEAFDLALEFDDHGASSLRPAVAGLVRFLTTADH
jgi:hypothetical protein